MPIIYGLLLMIIIPSVSYALFSFGDYLLPSDLAPSDRPFDIFTTVYRYLLPISFVFLSLMLYFFDSCAVARSLCVRDRLMPRWHALADWE
jgi:hypothetical protein